MPNAPRTSLVNFTRTAPFFPGRFNGGEGPNLQSACPDELAIAHREAPIGAHELWCMTIEVASVEAEEDFRRLYELFVEYEAWLPPDLRHGSVPDVEDLKAAYAARNAAFLAT